MVRMRNTRPDPAAVTTGLSPAIDDALKLALSVAATFARAHENCSRRSCRVTHRCHAAAEGDWCRRDLPREADDMALGMMVFAGRLLEGRP